MFSGEKINFTEKRAVLHTALRNFSKNPVIIDGQDVMPQIEAVREKMKYFVGSILDGSWEGSTGKRITDIVNIGIGGSHLGPAMFTKALQAYNKSGIRVHYVSNVDSDDIYEVFKNIKLEQTIFIIASKTFATLETMRNAFTAKKWFQEKISQRKEDIAKHFVALSTNTEACVEFGIAKENIFEFWDWVGGRYSIWSSIGLSTAIAIGWENFESILRGAYEIDRHFRSAPMSDNIPIIMGLLTVWYSTYWGFRSQAVIPYSHYLSMFPEFLQQLQMESNGKTVNYKGNKISYKTGQVIWGEAGTNSQHSFFQLLHQGSDTIPVDFISFIEPLYNNEDHHQWLLSNMIAQAEALMKGKSLEIVQKELDRSDLSEKEKQRLALHKVFEGNRPSNTILIDKLTPKSLGKLVALYEHKVFVEGIIWSINSFDQWGVELGKELSREIYKDLNKAGVTSTHDASTNSLINYIKTK
jgi:glucose-6-phosphate isomerase